MAKKLCSMTMRKCCFKEKGALLPVTTERKIINSQDMSLN